VMFILRPPISLWTNKRVQVWKSIPAPISKQITLTACQN